MANLNSPSEPGDFKLDKEIGDFQRDPLLEYLKEKTDNVAEKSPPASSAEKPVVVQPPAGTEFTPPAPDDLKKPRKPSKLANRSKSIVEIFDQLQETVHDELYKRSYFNRQERADLLRIRRIFLNHAKPGETLIGTEYENLLLDKVEEWDKYSKALPLDDEDKKDWAEAWKDLLQGEDTEMSPGKAFMVTTFLIFAPRWIPLFKKLPKHIGKLFGIEEEEFLPERKFSFEENK